MNNKLFTVAISAAFIVAPMIVQAEVMVYGNAQVELASEELSGDITFDPTGTTGAMSATLTSDKGGLSEEDNARGRFGVKASEDLGSGMLAFANFEWRVDTTDNTTTADGGSLSARQSIVGIKGGFGTIEFGRLKTPYKYMGGVKYDPFVTTNLEARGRLGMSGKIGTADSSGVCMGHTSFCSDMIGYQNKFGMVDLWIDYSIDENADSNANVGNRGDYSIGVKVGNRRWEGFFVTNLDNDLASGAAASDYTASKVGGQFRLGSHTVLGQYESTEQENVHEWTNLYLGYDMGMGRTILNVRLAVGEYDFDGGGGTAETTYTAVGLTHMFSRRTRVIAGYMQNEYDGGAGSVAEYNVLSASLRKDF